MITPELFSHFSVEPSYAMAIDELLLWRAERERSAFFRLYSWNPGGITIGYNQRRETAIDWTNVNGTPVVRRITGGRALFHDPSELTYSVAINLELLPVSDTPSVANMASAKVATGIVSFLEKIGMTTHFLRASRQLPDLSDSLHKAPCFASHARHEIVSDIGKIVASAARITPRAFFQHGSIKLNGVASHPALPLPTSIPQQKEKTELDFERFQELTEPFFQALSTSFSLGKGETGGIGTMSQMFLSDRLSLIQRDPTGKRLVD